MTDREYGTICLNLGFMSGMFFAASGDMPAEFSTASNVIRAICERQVAEENETPGSGQAQRPAPTTESESADDSDTDIDVLNKSEAQEDTEKKAEAEFKRSVCERLDAFRKEYKLGSFKELAKLAKNISADTITRNFNREPVTFLHYQYLNTALNKWEEQKMKGDNTVCQSEN